MHCLKSDIAAQNCQLHFFVDAYKEAYGAVCYLRIINSNGNANCYLLMSKSFLSPKNETLIPCLELLAAALAVKLNVTLTNELNLHLRPCIFWTDSAIVLHSIVNDRIRFPLFVFHRLSFITKHTFIANWNHVPTKLNSADILSCGCRADQFVKNSQWVNGPKFLKDLPSLWPCCEFIIAVRYYSSVVLRSLVYDTVLFLNKFLTWYDSQ